MNKFLIRVPSETGSKNLLEIINRADRDKPYHRRHGNAGRVVAEADGKNEAFETIKTLVENFLTENADRDFSKFREWCVK